MFADISLFNSLGAGTGTHVVYNSELLSFLKEYAEKSTGAMLCQQWLDSIRDRGDVTADLTARLSDAGHDYDKEKAKAASKLKDQMMDGDMVKLDQEDNAYISSLDPTIREQVVSMLTTTWKDKQASVMAQLQQGAELEDLLGGNAQVTPQASPIAPAPAAPAQAPAPTAAAPEMMPNDISDVEY